MKAEILSIGTELLLGEIIDTNAAYIAARLPGLGIDLYFKHTVGDNLGRVAEVMKRARENNDLVITYEVLVNGTVLRSFAYQRNFTRAVNIWANDTTYGLGKDGLAWAKETAAQFLVEVGKDPKIEGLVAEYAFYFSPAPKPGVN